MRTTHARIYGQALYGLAKELPEKKAAEAIERFVAWLAERRQTSLAEGILAGVEEAARRDEGTVRATVAAAEEPDAARKRELEAAVREAAGAPVEVLWTADPALVAGAVIRYGDTLLDASVKGKLERIKRHLTADA